MRARLIGSGKSAIYQVANQYGDENEVSILIRCTCKHHLIRGSKGEICSYALGLFRQIVEQGTLLINPESKVAGENAEIQAATVDEMKNVIRNQALQLIRPMNRKVNETRIGEGEGAAHASYKRIICDYLRAAGKQFVTEAIFVDRGRADIFVLDDFEVIEIMSTESDENVERKKEFYPEGVKVVAVRAN